MRIFSRFLFIVLCSGFFTLSAKDDDMPLSFQDSIVASEITPDVTLGDTVTIRRVIPAKITDTQQLFTRCLESLATLGLSAKTSDPMAGSIFLTEAFQKDQYGRIPYTLRVQIREGRIRCTIQFSALIITVGTRTTTRQLHDFYPINQAVPSNHLVSWRNMSFAFLQSYAILDHLTHDLSQSPDDEEW